MERCVRSVLDQTLDDIEFIFVDDRSPDSAYEIMLRTVREERYSHLKDRIKIVRHEKNKGVHVVRQTGLAASSGDYIYYCDSDDWMDRDMLRKLWEKAAEGDYDYVECSYFNAYGDGRLEERGRPDEKDLRQGWIEWPCCTSLCNKIFKRTVYQNDIIWPENPYLEDYTISLQLYYYSKTGCYIDEALYYYYQNPSSIMHTADYRKKAKGIMDQIGLLETFMRREGQYGKYRPFFLKVKAASIAEAWNLPWKEFVKGLPKDWLKVITCPEVTSDIRLGILSKLLGIHGIRGKKRS